MKWLDDMSYIFLIGAVVLMAMMPFQPEPHLVEKYHMWKAGELHRLLDIFDVFWHLLPAFLLILKISRDVMQHKGGV
ncbi:MAG: hypothetical protein COA61_002515 [Zetaproteobacteria bacterium]|nr:hypothetical protein [Zetaproteobacteria bacterium]